MTPLEINILENISEKLVNIDEKLKSLDNKLDRLENEEDEFKQAIKLANKDKNIRSSKLQRELKIGYNKAARYINEIKAMGIIS